MSTPERFALARARSYDDLEQLVLESYRPSGKRLGILVVPDEDAARGAADRALRAHGIDSGRRLARVQPRPGEDGLRAEDLVDFILRYGHEYSVVLVGRGTVEAMGDEFCSAARRSGASFVECPE